MAVPFILDMNFDYGAPQQVSPLIRRVMSNNPGPFTFRGTGVYIIGRGDVAVIDPGPDQPGQFDMLKRALDGERVTHIFVTHGHLDHSPMARPLAEFTGAKVYASGSPIRPGATGEEGDDLSFKPDVALKDGAKFSGPGWTLEAIATPGHASDHFCFALPEENALFSGDHIMGWSTSVIAPPDGDMGAYLKSLEKIQKRNFDILWPTHGPPVTNTQRFINALIGHRLFRERQILDKLAAGPAAIPAMVEAFYAGVDKRLHAAASLSLLAHMLRLIDLGKVKSDGAPDLNATYALKR